LTRKKIIAAVVLAAGVLSLAAVLLVGALAPAGGEGDSIYAANRPAVGVIEINGMIVTGRSSGSLFGGALAGSQTITAQLRQVAKNPRIKAVVLRINSPGGTPAAAQEISDEVVRLKKQGVKVVASMGDVAASGAYWIASSADSIVANPGTITGSIGVIMETNNYRGLYDKLGIEGRTFKSGSYKDMGSSSRPVSAEEANIFQSMVDDIYQQFIDTVAGNRKLSPEAIRQLNGRVITGRQAVNTGLADRLGGFYDAVSLAGEISGLGRDPGLVSLEQKRQWWQLLEDLESSIGPVRFDLSTPGGQAGVLLISPPAGN